MAEVPVKSLTREERVSLGRNRYRKVLTRHVIALGRTLEQKIADAGPAHMRINPHILTEAKAELIELGRSYESATLADRPGSIWPTPIPPLSLPASLSNSQYTLAFERQT